MKMILALAIAALFELIVLLGGWRALKAVSRYLRARRQSAAERRDAGRPLATVVQVGESDIGVHVEAQLTPAGKRVLGEGLRRGRIASHSISEQEKLREFQRKHPLRDQPPEPPYAA